MLSNAVMACGHVWTGVGRWAAPTDCFLRDSRKLRHNIIYDIWEDSHLSRYIIFCSGFLNIGCWRGHNYRGRTAVLLVHSVSFKYHFRMVYHIIWFMIVVFVFHYFLFWTNMQSLRIFSNNITYYMWSWFMTNFFSEICNWFLWTGKYIWGGY